MSAVRSLRGQPIIALVAVLGGWMGGRAATWTPPFAVPEAAALQTPSPTPPNATLVADPRTGPQTAPGAGDGASGYALGPYGPMGGYPAAYPVAYPPGMAAIPPGYVLVPAASLGRATTPRVVYAMPPRGAGWYLPGSDLPVYRLPAGERERAALAAGEPAPRFLAPEAAGAGSAAATPGSPASPAKPKRWSADAWALLRRDGATGLGSPGALPASYGASQAGAVLRYRLSLTDPHKPAFYMRTTSSMGQLRETSAALGLSARPLPRLPVVAAIEGRLTEQGGRRRIQPVAMAVTELAPFGLPAGLRGEAYGQAGYVAGKFATPFADGQLRVDRGLLRVGRVDTRVGGGIWGGAQKGAARLDVGPTATVAMPLGRGTFGRVAVDWRFRMAGEAHPGSGPAVTLSAGF